MMIRRLAFAVPFAVAFGMAGCASPSEETAASEEAVVSGNSHQDRILSCGHPAALRRRYDASEHADVHRCLVGVNDRALTLVAQRSGSAIATQLKSAFATYREGMGHVCELDAMQFAPEYGYGEDQRAAIRGDCASDAERSLGLLLGTFADLGETPETLPDDADQPQCSGPYAAATRRASQAERDAAIATYAKCVEQTAREDAVRHTTWQRNYCEGLDVHHPDWSHDRAEQEVERELNRAFTGSGVLCSALTAASPNGGWPIPRFTEGRCRLHAARFIDIHVQVSISLDH